MTEAKFTPGPWEAHETGRSRSGVPEHEIHWSYIGECVAEIVHGPADAHLIAAAPKLYAALSYLNENGEMPLGTTIDDLLAEARGETA